MFELLGVMNAYVLQQKVVMIRRVQRPTRMLKPLQEMHERTHGQLCPASNTDAKNKTPKPRSFLEV